MVGLEGLSQEEVAKRSKRASKIGSRLRQEKVLGRSFETMSLLTLI